jgi:hypothetical protein
VGSKYALGVGVKFSSQFRVGCHRSQCSYCKGGVRGKVRGDSLGELLPQEPDKVGNRERRPKVSLDSFETPVQVGSAELG